MVEIETTNNFRMNNVKCNRLGDVFLMVRNSKMLKNMKLNEINREEIVPIVICYEQNTSLPILCPTTTPNIIINSSNETICSGVPVSVINFCFLNSISRIFKNCRLLYSKKNCLIFVYPI